MDLNNRAFNENLEIIKSHDTKTSEKQTKNDTNQKIDVQLSIEINNKNKNNNNNCKINNNKSKCILNEYDDCKKSIVLSDKCEEIITKKSINITENSISFQINFENWCRKTFNKNLEDLKNDNEKHQEKEKEILKNGNIDQLYDYINSTNDKKKSKKRKKNKNKNANNSNKPNSENIDNNIPNKW